MYFKQILNYTLDVIKGFKYDFFSFYFFSHVSFVFRYFPPLLPVIVWWNPFALSLGTDRRMIIIRKDLHFVFCIRVAHII